MDELNAAGFNEKTNSLFKTFYYNNLFRPKQYLNIFHDKLSGRRINLTPGIIKKIERNRSISDHLKIILKRNLNASVGTYDGLDIPIEEGDYAIGVYESDKMYYESIYYSRQNELKGKYFNINTPIMFRDDGIHYIDLEIDVVEPLNGKRKIIDEDLLNKAFDLKIISKTLYDQANEIAQKIESGVIPGEIVKTGQNYKISI
jgi:predicted RNA-binding protein associated with RNAse of E/G family